LTAEHVDALVEAGLLEDRWMELAGGMLFDVVPA